MSETTPSNPSATEAHARASEGAAVSAVRELRVCMGGHEWRIRVDRGGLPRLADRLGDLAETPGVPTDWFLASLVLEHLSEGQRGDDRADRGPEPAVRSLPDAGRVGAGGAVAG